MSAASWTDVQDESERSTRTPSEQVPALSSSSIVKGRRPPRFEFVKVSPWAYRFAWLGILTLHLFCMGYLALVAKLYATLPGTYLDTCLDFYALGMKRQHYPTIAFVHWFFMAGHVVLVALMLVFSLIERRLVFSPFQHTNIQPLAQKSADRGGRRVRRTPAQILMDNVIRQLQPLVARVYDPFFGRLGLFGVESRYFDMVMILRECTETVLQSYQAYRMSLHVPRVWLNRFFITMLVINCWVTPVIHSISRSKRMTHRLLWLLSDAVLDLLSSIGVPIILLLRYAKDYDTSFQGFDTYYWYDDTWLINFMNEFQLVLVVSWTDLLTRAMFYAGLIGCMESVKDLVRPKRVRSQKTYAGTEADAAKSKQSFMTPMTARLDTAHLPWVARVVLPKLELLVRRLKSIIHGTFAVWGIAVLVLHLYAETQKNMEQCLMQVRPWTASKPACALLIMDCHIDNVPGLAEDIIPQWEIADEATVTRIVIRHCPQLHMPTRIKAFPQLYAIKIYNSTIAEWEDDAALTNTHHSGFSTLLMVRTNFTDGQLPPGIMSKDFPQLLYDIEFQITNLKDLPDDLDTSWLVGSYLYFENCQFDHIPPVLHRIAPNQLSMAFNRFTSFPFDVFQIDGLSYLSLAGNPIDTLSKTPYEDVVDVGTVTRFYLLETNISFIPRWLDPLITRMTDRPSILIRGSPFCQHVDEIAAGSRTQFPEVDTMPSNELSKVMSSTKAKLDALENQVSCSFPDVLFYPYSYEDKWYGLE
ncbi:hypothetical protein Poli38472_008029 [Pythium oligandrum]|uniref:Uncharacterized protein n=1 Tax=Pythium oligandrum TaxID=41045 RepID=A0A8K1FN08_PYTOL|nr:hypothetical protein Poli38472_008029 [Pythium oligandrum]|eukprot:TMW65387.1 hypothetical protein Poli38472_008029 [Pythium oligandrum]